MMRPWQRPVDAVGFEDLGLFPELQSALSKDGYREPRRIQIEAILLIFDVIIRAKKGSGKTLAYVISVINRCIFKLCSSNMDISGPLFLVICPTDDSCKQVSGLFESLCKLCSLCTSFKIATLTSTTLSDIPDIAVSTPDYLLQSGFLEDKARQISLQFLILDDVDKLVLDGNDHFLKSLIASVEEYCVCIVVSDDPSSDLRQLKALVRCTPYIVTLPEGRPLEVEIIPYNVKQRYVSCDANDKLLYIFSLMAYGRINGASLIYTNSSEMSKRLSRNLELLELKSAVLSSEGDRVKIIEQLKTGDHDLIIVDDESPNPLRGIDLNYVHTVVHYEMPLSISRYVERIDHTGKPTGYSIALVSPKDMEIWEDIKAHFEDDSKFIAPYAPIQPFMTRKREKYFRRMIGEAMQGVKSVWRVDCPGCYMKSESDSD